LIIAAALTGCSGQGADCNANDYPLAQVEVVDATTGAAICDATVTVCEGDYKETLFNDFSNGGTVDDAGLVHCRYTGGIRPGGSSCPLTVSAPGYQSATRRIPLEINECGQTITQYVTVKLTPG
jgi:hypothetical protein